MYDLQTVIILTEIFIQKNSYLYYILRTNAIQFVKYNIKKIYELFIFYFQQIFGNRKHLILDETFAVIREQEVGN